MDVILDSNAYLADIRMESIRFKNLFQYLRRTRSLLVLPRLVREEIVAKHRSRLEIQGGKTAKAIEDFNRLRVDPTAKISFTKPDPKYEVRNLRKKLRAPAKHVAVRFYDDVSAVDVNEVFLRGVRRRRPASEQGEELRDVILWLIALQYAEAEKKGVALITADHGFWNGEEVHEHLREDIRKRALDVRLFRTVDDFVKSNALSQSVLDEDEVATFFDINSLSGATIFEQTRAAFKQRLETNSFWHFASIPSVQSVQLSEAKFAEGILYEIDPDTKLAELRYEVTFAVQGEAKRASLGWPPGVSHNLLFGGSLAQELDPFAEQQYHSLTDRLGGKASMPGRPEPDPEERDEYTCRGNAYVFVRFVGRVPRETELDRIEILDIQRTDNARPRAKETPVTVASQDQQT